MCIKPKVALEELKNSACDTIVIERNGVICQRQFVRLMNDI